MKFQTRVRKEKDFKKLQDFIIFLYENQAKMKWYDLELWRSREVGGVHGRATMEEKRMKTISINDAFRNYSKIEKKIPEEINKLWEEVDNARR